jgi:hypothetical protein
MYSTSESGQVFNYEFQGSGGHRQDAEHDDLRVSTLDANEAFDKIATGEIQHARTIIDL